MGLPCLQNVGVFRYAQKGSQIIRQFRVGLYISGCVRSESYYPDGTLARTFDSSKEQDVPTLSLTAPGFKVDFEFNENRENWVLIFDYAPIIFDENDKRFYWLYHEHRVPLPRSIRLSMADAEDLRRQFDRVCRLFRSSLPQNVLEAELELLMILKYFLRCPVRDDDAVELFRKNVEEDFRMDFTLEDHCGRIGINRDILRNKFIERYGISPGEFRRRIRLRKILHLLTETDLALKEIAFECGMKNLSHLSSFIRKECGKTASELGRECRGKNG